MDKIKTLSISLIMITFFLSCEKQKEINFADFKTKKYNLIYQGFNSYGLSYNLNTDLVAPIVPNNEVQPCIINLSVSKKDSIVSLINELNLLKNTGLVVIKDTYEHLPVFSSSILIFQNSKKISEFELYANPKSVIFSPQKRKIIKLFNLIGRILNENYEYKNKQKELNEYQKKNSIFAI